MRFLASKSECRVTHIADAGGIVVSIIEFLLEAEARLTVAVNMEFNLKFATLCS